MATVLSFNVSGDDERLYNEYVKAYAEDYPVEFRRSPALRHVMRLGIDAYFGTRRQKESLKVVDGKVRELAAWET
jgi:hypothetical protein